MRVHLVGVSLVETLVAMSLGIVLGLVASVAYVQAKRDFMLQRQLVQLQDTGRYALRLLGREVSLSGFFGGLPPGQASVVSVPGEGCIEGWALDATVGLEVLDDLHVAPTPVAALQGCLDLDSVLPGTDVIAVRRTAAEPAMDNGKLAPGLSSSDIQRWYLRLGEGLKSSWRKQSARSLHQLETSSGVSYWRAMSGIYFIRPWAVDNGDGIPTLCVDALAGSTMPVRCLAEGVEDLQLQFGFDTDDDGVANRYGNAGSGDLNEAVSARIFLLLRTIEVVNSGVGNTAIAVGDRMRHFPGDGYARQVVSTTIPLDARVRLL